MAKPKKWSEQTLVEQSFTDIENGKEVDHVKNVLTICTSGLEHFRKDLMEGDGMNNNLIVPFDFLAMAGDGCPKGSFYEMEYTIGGPSGVYYRGLIQAVNPVTDIRLVVGGLQHANILPKDLVPHKAWLRDDIDVVCIGACVFNIDTNQYELHGRNYTPSDVSDSVLDHVLGKSGDGCVHIDYYRGDVHEVTIKHNDKFVTPDIFVCGSDNVNDPVFASQRKADLEEMLTHIDEAICIAQQYNIPYFFLYDTGEATGSVRDLRLASAIDINMIQSLIDQLRDKNKEEQA